MIHNGANIYVLLGFAFVVIERKLDTKVVRL
jgi:hypothetical protein